MMLTSDTATEIIYDDDQIRVIWHPGHSDFVLITFGDFFTTLNGHRFFADTPAAKAGLAAIGVVSKGPNFYPKSSVMAAAPAINARTAGFAHRVIYGGSMGGYAAVKHSGLLRATEVIALCAPWSIDAAECEGHFPGWPELFTPAMTGHGVRPDEVSGAIFVFSDLFDDVDRFHAGMILRTDPTATIINVPRVGHHVTGMFAGTQILLDLIAACRARDIPELTRQTRVMRKRSPWLWFGLIPKAIERHPGLTYRAMAARPNADVVIGNIGARHLFKAVEYLLAKGELNAAINYIETYRHGLADVQDILLAGAILQQLSGRACRIVTFHGTSLVYDLGQRACIHIAQPIPHLHVPVQLQLAGTELALFVELGGVRVMLGVNHESQISDQFSNTTNAGRFSVSSQRNNQFVIAQSGRFLSASPDGPISCDRDAAYEWEQFRIE